MKPPVTHITKEVAAEAATRAAFDVTDPESSEYGRKVVHCFVGASGAHWDLAQVLIELDNAEKIAWTNHLLGHDLTVLANGTLYNFGVKRPTEGGA